MSIIFNRKAVHLALTVLMAVALLMSPSPPLQAGSFFNYPIALGARASGVVLENQNGPVAVLVRSKVAVDVDEASIQEFLNANSVNYELIDAAMIQSGAVDLLTYGVLYMRTGVEPVEYNQPQVITKIRASVENGANLIVEYYGVFLAKYLGLGTISFGSWGPNSSDATYFVETITPTEILRDIRPWSPPAAPDNGQQLISLLTNPGYYVYPILSFSEPFERASYWFLLTTYGWDHQTTDSLYCLQHLGVCQLDRSVYEADDANGYRPQGGGIMHAGLGLGRVYRLGLGLGQAVPTNAFYAGPVARQMRLNVLAGETPDLHVSNFSPSAGGNIGDVTVTVNGAGFDPDAELRLLDGEQIVAVGASTSVPSSTQIQSTFDLYGQTTRDLRLEVANPNGQIAAAAVPFAVVAGGGGGVNIQVLAPSHVRVGRQVQFMTVVANQGFVDLAEVLVHVSVLFGPAVLYEATTSISLPAGASVSVPGSVTFPSEGCGSINAAADPCAHLREQIRQTEVELRQWREELAGVEAAIRRKRCDNDPNADPDCPYYLRRRRELRDGIRQAEELLRQAREELARCERGNGAGPSVPLLIPTQNFVLDASVATVAVPICAESSWDPNDKVGVGGAGDAHYISPLYHLDYRLFYENVYTATAPAEEVLLIDQLNEGLDWPTFTFGTLTLGEQVVVVPPGVWEFAHTLDLRPQVVALVDIHLKFNPTTGRIEVLLRGRDPATGQLTGFLPPNASDVAPQGEGSISYKVRLKPNLPTGTMILNMATIDFEVGVFPPELNTPTVTYTVDAEVPTSAVDLLAPIHNEPEFEVSWSGTDVGSGVDSYTIYVAEDSGPYVPWLTSVLSTTAVFEGAPGHTYHFFSRARDKGGNYQELSMTAEATTFTLYRISLPLVMSSNP